MSKTEEIDATIAALNEELARPKLPLKSKLAITDRLTRLYSLKLKHSEDGKGGKFNLPTNPGATQNAGNTRQ